MVWVQDTSVNFTVTFQVLEEGYGAITQVIVAVTDQFTGTTTYYTGVVSYTDSTGTITWSPEAPAAKEGDTINVNVTVENQGNATDILYAKMDTNLPSSEQIESDAVAPGSQVNLRFSPLTMPGYDLNVTLTAGHEYT